jgi:signal peptide peptidase SppA
MFSEVQSIYARHLRGEKIDLAALEAKIGAPLPGATRGYDVTDNGVAIIPVDGVLSKRMNLLSQISGGTSMSILGADIQQALDDPLVNTIILNIDSPGGTVDGTQQLSDLIFNARGTKPIIALADGTMASAAYWIGSAADEVYAASQTTTIGSIGVVATHTDVSGAEAMDGYKTTEITAGKYKRIASQYAPLTQDGRQSIQDSVDYTYSIFVNDVARNRGTDAETVVNNMADGRTFQGQQAVDAGLVDGIATLEQLIGRAAAGEFAQYMDDGADDPANPLTQQAGAPAGEQPQPESGGNPQTAQTPTQANEETMDVTKLKAEHPDVAAALIAEGATAERERIQAVHAAAMPGHEKLIATLAFDGKTTGGEAALQVIAAEKAKKGNRLAAMQADAAAATVPHAAAPEPGEEEDENDDGQNADDMEDGASASPSGGKAKKKASAITMQNAGAIAAQAQVYQAEQRAKGVKISFAQAVDHVSAAK